MIAVVTGSSSSASSLNEPPKVILPLFDDLVMVYDASHAHPAMLKVCALIIVELVDMNEKLVLTVTLASFVRFESEPLVL